jgi:hypothetical protein
MEIELRPVGQESERPLDDHSEQRVTRSSLARRLTAVSAAAFAAFAVRRPTSALANYGCCGLAWPPGSAHYPCPSTGTGHWTCPSGYTARSWFCCDPTGHRLTGCGECMRNALGSNCFAGQAGNFNDYRCSYGWNPGSPC